MKDYKSLFYTSLLSMPNGTNNPKWDEACELIDRVETLATELRCALEDLSEFMSNENALLTYDIDGYEDEMEAYEVQDLANQVCDIETMFFNENE